MLKAGRRTGLPKAAQIPMAQHREGEGASGERVIRGWTFGKDLEVANRSQVVSKPRRVKYWPVFVIFVIAAAMPPINVSSVVAANVDATLTAQATAPDNAARGVSDTEVLFGMVAPFSGASRELGRQMKIGVETAFDQTNFAAA